MLARGSLARAVIDLAERTAARGCGMPIRVGVMVRTAPLTKVGRFALTAAPRHARLGDNTALFGPGPSPAALPPRPPLQLPRQRME